MCPSSTIDINSCERYHMDDFESEKPAPPPHIDDFTFSDLDLRLIFQDLRLA